MTKHRAFERFGLATMCAFALVACDGGNDERAGTLSVGVVVAGPDAAAGRSGDPIANDPVTAAFLAAHVDSQRNQSPNSQPNPSANDARPACASATRTPLEIVGASPDHYRLRPRCSGGDLGAYRYVDLWRIPDPRTSVLALDKRDVDVVLNPPLADRDDFLRIEGVRLIGPQAVRDVAPLNLARPTGP